MAALGALVSLVALQSFLFIRKIKVKKQTITPDVSRAADVIKSLKKASKTPPPAKKQPSDKLDSGVFARFEANLEKQDSVRQPEPIDKDEDVIVSISSKSKSMPAAAKPLPAAPKKESANKEVPDTSKIDAKKHIESLRKINKSIKVDSIEGLFDDVEEDVKKPEPQAIPKPEVKSEINQPIAANEFLSEEDLNPVSEKQEEGIDLVLSMVRQEFEEEKYEEALAIIRQYLNDQKSNDASSEQMVELIELKADCEAELHQFDRAAKTLQEVVTIHITKNSPDYLNQLEKYMEKFKMSGQEKHSLHFMFTALNEYRQLHDHQKMDQIYDDIEIAYRQTEDWSRLVQTYQNHLSIKKVLKDYQGQLDILDNLGKLLYDQGEEDKSRKCYKQRLVVEKEMERATK